MERVNLLTKTGRATALTRAQRLGLLNPRSAVWHVAYLLGEAAVMPPSLIHAAGAAASQVGGDHDAAGALARLARAGWAEDLAPPRPAGRPPRRWRLSERGEAELPGFAGTWELREPERARRYLAWVLLDAGVEKVWTTPELLTATAWRAWRDGQVVFSEPTLRREVDYLAESHWLSAVRLRQQVAPWRLTAEGVRVLSWLHRIEAEGTLPRPPRVVTGPVREHDLRIARIAADMLPWLSTVQDLQIGRSYYFDPDLCRLTVSRRGDYCVPDVFAWAHQGEDVGWRLVCVEVEAFASIPNLERHLAGYAGLAETHLARAKFAEMVVAIVSRDRPARRAAVERVLATFPSYFQRLPLRFTLAGPGRVARLCRTPLDEIDAIGWEQPS